MSQIRYWLWLSTLPGISLLGQLKALRHFGSPEEVYLSDGAALGAVPGLQKKEIQALLMKDLRRANDVLEDCRKLEISILTIQDAMYPERLRNIDMPPLVLYYKGTFPAFDEIPALAVVGARKASSYGLLCAKQLGYQIGKCGGMVISGAAKGVDSLALESALSAGGRACAVLGNGLDIVYPAEASALYRDLAEKGCLISEYVPGTAPLGTNFPRRNRILSGLSLGDLVVEAAKKSGSLITAEMALEQGRDVFAVPGNIGLACCEGSNQLIQDGAKLVTCAWDMLEEYEPLFPGQLHDYRRPARTTLSPRDEAGEGEGKRKEKSPKTNPAARRAETKKSRKIPEEVQKIDENEKNAVDIGDKSNYIDLERIKSTVSEEEGSILSILEQGERYVDELVQESGLSAAKVLSALTMLEIQGYVSQLAGKRFALSIQADIGG